MFDFLFGKNKDQYASEYDTAISNAKQDRADAAYNYRYNKALYDTNKDYFDKIGVKDPSASYWNDSGQRTNDFTETMNQYGKYLNDLNKEKEDVAWRNRYNIFGDGLVGSLLNPFHQAGTAVQDFVSSGTKEWNNGNRDVLSDLGALGETALNFVPFLGAGSKALKGATGLGRSVLTGAGYGAGYGLAGSLKDMGSENFNGGELALNTLLGGAVGGGLSAAGAGLGKVWNKYSQPAPSKSTDIIPYTGGGNMADPKLQEYMKTLGVTGDNMTAESLNSARKQATKNIAKTMGYETSEGQAQRTAVNNAYQALLDSLNGKGATMSAPVANSAPTLSFAEKLKNFGSNIPNMGKDLANTKVGNNVANLLKTKKGKVLLGGSAGLTLAGLMKNRNDNTGQLSDEEMQELYNYVYGGQ